MAREIRIYTPDGGTTNVPLTESRMVVGRSNAAELSYPEDAGLSRQHFCFEPDNGEWAVEDLGSKNGTFVNAIPLKGRLRLKAGDRITAGHLVLEYGGGTQAKQPPSVVVFDPSGDAPSTSTLVTSLEGVLSKQTMVLERGGAAPMQALIRAGQELARSRPLDDLFRVILDLAVDAVGAQRGVVMVADGGFLEVKAHKGEGFRISSAVRDRVMEEKCSVLVSDTSLDEAFRSRASIVQQRIRTMMAAPLQTKDRIIGLIYVDSPSLLRRFSENDLSLLTVMANVAAIRIEHARLAEVEHQERIMQRDLTQAAEIQRRILPDKPPVVKGVDLAGYNSPCRTVGGDYYDFFAYPDGSVGLALGDVSGKGMPASLMVMGLQARLHVLAEDPVDLAVMMARLNRITCANCPSNRFITFFFSRFHPGTGELDWCNAGHNPPLIVRASGDIETLEGGGPVLGIVAFAEFTNCKARLARGDMLVVFSDGVTEATNAEEEEFGDARLCAVLTAHHSRPVAEVVAGVTEALAAFVGSSPQADDITLVVLRAA
jgi:phosphoserine phosphatase RsbU/P